jgi:hypothetical protein
LLSFTILIYINPPISVGGMEEEGQNKFDSKFSGGSRRNGGRQAFFITLICFISILQNLCEQWRKRDRINLTDTLNSLEGAGGMEE